MSVQDSAAKMLSVEIKKALDGSRIHSVSGVHEDLVVLVWWSVDPTHLLLLGESSS